MDTQQTQSAATGNEELREKCATLQSQINVLLFALLLVSGTVSVYLYMQDRWTSRELQALKGPSSTIIQSFEQHDKPRIQNFISRLVDYGKTHPDFAPIVDKYKLSSTATNAPAK